MKVHTACLTDSDRFGKVFLREGRMSNAEPQPQLASVRHDLGSVGTEKYQNLAGSVDNLDGR